LLILVLVLLGVLMPRFFIHVGGVLAILIAHLLGAGGGFGG